MNTVNDIYQFLTSFAPIETKESWDNVGLLCGRSQNQVSKILLALDPSPQAAAEAIEQGVQLLVTHHPIAFELKRITEAQWQGRVLLDLIEHKIALISMHTNMDAAVGGVNDVLAQKLQLHDIMPLHQAGINRDGLPYGIGRMGTVSEEITLADFAGFVGQVLHCSGLRYCGKRWVSKVAVIGGSGADMMEEAREQGCDTLVTGDASYHKFIDAQEMGINLIDAGHFETENPVIEALHKKLQMRFPEISCLASKKHENVIKFAYPG